MTDSFEIFTRDPKGYARTKASLVFYSLTEVLELYHEEIVEYFGIEEYEFPYLNGSNYEIACLVDLSETKIHTMKPLMRKRYRKAGKLRRRKLEDKYHYKNPLNRIHAYIMVETSPGKSTPETIGFNVICSSNYSDIKGLGNYTISSAIEAAERAGYKEIVLEVGNDEAQEHPYSDSSSEESESESESEEESEEEPDMEELIAEVVSSLWKKSVRHRGSLPYYSVGEDYIHTIVSSYINNEETDWTEPETNTDEEYGYGGYFYRKGKSESKKLMDYYESFGFREDPNVHIEKKCFSDVPFPSMCLTL